MKKMAVVLFVSAFLLNGCEIMGPSVKVKPPKVRVEGVNVETESADSNGRFCPPGQAKKGNC